MLTPEFDSKIALEIVNKHQILDEDTFYKETSDSIPFDEDYTVEKVGKSNRGDYYLVNNEDERQELKKALTHLFEGNAVHYKKRIRLQ